METYKKIKAFVGHLLIACARETYNRNLLPIRYLHFVKLDKISNKKFIVNS